MKTLNKIARILWLTFCEVDEKFLDLFRIGYALVLITGLSLTVYSVVSANQEFDLVAFGTGLGAILFGGGVGVGLRGRFEDGPTNDKEEEANPGPDWSRNSPWSDRRDTPQEDGSHWFDESGPWNRGE